MVEEKIDIKKIITIESMDFNNAEVTRDLFKTLLNFIEIQQETIEIQKKEIKIETNKNWHKQSKKEIVKIDHTETVEMDESKLPIDAEFKGYRKVIIQNVKIETDNVLYKIPQWYSAIEGKTYSPELPE